MLKGFATYQGKSTDACQMVTDLGESGGRHVPLVEDVGGDAKGALESAAMGDIHGHRGGHGAGSFADNAHSSVEGIEVVGM